jgi:hypothetical protein
MNYLLFLLITICAVILVIYLLNSLLNQFFNFKMLLRKSHFSDAFERENGLIYNPKAKKLEADQSNITMF